MSKVLVFGGTRFLGKELVKELLINGHDVTIATTKEMEDSFKDKVKRIFVNKRDYNDLSNALKDKEYDVVYDTISYSSNDGIRMCKALNEKTKKYIVVSSIAVYDYGNNLGEKCFDPNKYNIVMGEKEYFSYKEGKRLMEAATYKNAKFKVIAVRFPVVIGKDDSSERLLTYIKKVKNKETIYSTKLNSYMNMITQNEAGIFLAWLLDKDIHGPINAACIGKISIKEIINSIEDELKIEGIVDNNIDKEETSPYNKWTDITMDIKNIMEIGGYRFKEVHSEVRDIIKYYKNNFNI